MWEALSLLEQVEQYAPVARLRQETADAAQCRAGGVAVGGEIQVDGKHRHADRAKRDEPDFDVAAGQPFAQQGPDADADGKHRK